MTARTLRSAPARQSAPETRNTRAGEATRLGLHRVFETDRQVAQPLAGRVVDRVRHRGGDADDADLPHPFDTGAVHQLVLFFDHQGLHVDDIGVNR